MVNLCIHAFGICRASAAENIAHNPALARALEANDAYQTLGILASEKGLHHLDALSAADAAGYVVSSTRSQSRGANVFLTSALGRALLSGNDATSTVGAAAADTHQLFFGAAQAVGQPRSGLLFVSNFADDNFAEVFKEKYLSQDAEVGFYTDEFGLFGSSLVGGDRTSLAALNFNEDLSALRLKLSGGTYLMRTIPLPGLEGSQGGMVILVRVGQGAYILAGLVMPALVFVGFALYLNRRLRERRVEYFYTALVLGTILFLVITTGSLAFFSSSFKKTYGHPPQLYNSVLYILPNTGVFSTLFAQPLTVMLDTGAEDINAVSVDLSWDPQIFSVEAADPDPSRCPILVHKELISGHLRLECAIPNPGFQGTGSFVSLSIVAARAGVAALHFEDGTQVLANDGLGTNVLREARDKALQFDDQSDSSLLLYSPSHPNAARWYSARQITLVWFPPQRADIMAMGPALTSERFSAAIPPFTYRAVEDGRYIFAVEQGTSSARYAANIDSTPPQVEVETSQNAVAPGTTVRLLLSGEDALSGLQHNFYLSLDHSLFYPTGEEAYVPLASPGVHSIVARLFDNAGNRTDREVFISVIPSTTP